MIYLITGASHTGKTVLAQKLMEKHHIPYLSLDLLKMGLIRSKYTNLTPQDDQQLTEYLWPIVREMIKTAIENEQSLIVEGCYIPFDWKASFSAAEQSQIHYRCLVFSEEYIRHHFQDIIAFANAVEHRLDDSACTMEWLLKENADYLSMCNHYHLDYFMVTDRYNVEPDLQPT